MNKEQTKQMAEVMLAWCAGAKVGFREREDDKLTFVREPTWTALLLWGVMPEPHSCADCKVGDPVLVWNLPHQHKTDGFTFCGRTKSGDLIVENHVGEISQWGYGEPTQ